MFGRALRLESVAAGTGLMIPTWMFCEIQTCKKDAFELALWCRKCRGVSPLYNSGDGKFRPKLGDKCMHYGRKVESGDCIHV